MNDFQRGVLFLLDPALSKSTIKNGSLASLYKSILETTGHSGAYRNTLYFKRWLKTPTTFKNSIFRGDYDFCLPLEIKVFLEVAESFNASINGF